MEERVRLGTINEYESTALIAIIRKKNIVRDLLTTFSDDRINSMDDFTILYDKIKSDYEKLLLEQNEWWVNIAKQYNWSYKSTQRWQINFDTSEVFLIG